MKHVVLSPHLDDAVLSLGGLLHKHAQDASVITFFTGTPERSKTTLWDLISGFTNSTAAMEARRKEDLEALAALGITSITHLPFLDRQYRPDAYEVEALVDTLDILLRALRAYADEEVRVYGPKLTVHADHALVQDVMREHARMQAPKYSYFLYEDLPYATFRSQRRKASRLQHKNSSGLPHVIELSESDMAMKIAAIHTYASQLRPLGGARRLKRKIRSYAKEQALAAHTNAPYAEVVYELLPVAGSTGSSS